MKYVCRSVHLKNMISMRKTLLSLALLFGASSLAVAEEDLSMAIPVHTACGITAYIFPTSRDDIYSMAKKFLDLEDSLCSTTSGEPNPDTPQQSISGERSSTPNTATYDDYPEIVY